MKSFSKYILLLFFVASVVSCKAGKKPKCNTCPKWDDRMEVNSAAVIYEEQH